MNMIQALNDAHKVMMARDEDIGYFGGVFRVTEGLQRQFGKTRTFDAPISEGGIVATAVGMAAYGIKPVIEIQFADYIYPGYDQIVSEVAKMRYRTAGEWTMPMVIRTPYGGGIFGGQTHSQSPESLFTHIAGLKVVIPSTPYDAKGLLIAAINRPLASYGVEGMTTLRPAMWVKSDSGDWLWVWPPKMPPPYGVRMTIGIVHSAAVR
jgi:2-oxoisovalerate dehydrogenase E1 component beta subunit